MTYNGALIKEGTVLKSNPSTHTVTVDTVTDTQCGPIECAILMPHGSGSNDAHMISMPSLGQKVLILLDSSQDNGVVLGTLPKASLGTEPSDWSKEFDKLAGKLREVNYRGEDYDDILPGDISIRSKQSRILLSDNELSVGTGAAIVDMSSAMGGHSIIHSQADIISHKNSLFNYKVSDPGGGSIPSFELQAFTQEADDSALSRLFYNSSEADTSIKINSATPLEVAYAGKAAVSIDSMGRLLLKGSSVTIETDGQVHKFGEKADLNTIYREEVTLGSEKNTTLSSKATMSITGTATKVSGDNSINISSASGSVGILAGGIPSTLALPGIDQSMTLEAPNGAIQLKAGSYIPGPGSLTKPGIRLQSDGGGDIHLSSVPSPGGLFTTGALVIDSATPVSSTGGGGIGNYGVVLNSPHILIGGIPGVADTPAGVLAPFGPPVPPIYDGFVKHFPFMTVYNVALAAGVAAGLAAAFPPSAVAATAAFGGAFSAALTTVSMPPVGRPISMVSIG